MFWSGGEAARSPPGTLCGWCGSRTNRRSDKGSRLTGEQQPSERLRCKGSKGTTRRSDNHQSLDRFPWLTALRSDGPIQSCRSHCASGGGGVFDSPVATVTRAITATEAPEERGQRLIQNTAIARFRSPLQPDSASRQRSGRHLGHLGPGDADLQQAPPPARAGATSQRCGPVRPASGLPPPPPPPPRIRPDSRCSPPPSAAGWQW